jgi:hypothetical protein
MQLSIKTNMENSEYIVIAKADIEKFIEKAKEVVIGVDFQLIEAFAKWMYEHDVSKERNMPNH